MSTAVITKPTKAQVRAKQKSGTVLVFRDEGDGHDAATCSDKDIWYVTGVEPEYSLNDLFSSWVSEPLALFYEED